MNVFLVTASHLIDGRQVIYHPYESFVERHIIVTVCVIIIIVTITIIIIIIITITIIIIIIIIGKMAPLNLC